MILPDTQPGTEVVCVDDSAGMHGPSGLARGNIYTVDRIRKGLRGEFVAILADVEPSIGYVAPWGVVTVGYALRRFRYLDIPESLTSLLEARRRSVEHITFVEFPEHTVKVSICAPEEVDPA